MALLCQWAEEITSEINKKAEEELGETFEVREFSLNEMRKKIREETDLEVPTDNFLLLRFLRVKKYDVPRSFQMLKNYFSYKSKYSGKMIDVSVQDLAWILEMNKFVVPDSRHPSGSTVIYISLPSFDLDVISLEKATAGILTTLDILLCNEVTQIGGISFVLNYGGLSYRLLAQIYKPSFLIPGVQSITNTMPCRIREMHVVNEPSVMRFFYNTLARPLLTKKLRERIVFHGDNHTELLKKFPAECLPEVLGGSIGSKEFDDFRREILDRRDLLERLQSYTFKGKSFSPQENL